MHLSHTLRYPLLTSFIPGAPLWSKFKTFSLVALILKKTWQIYDLTTERPSLASLLMDTRNPFITICPSESLSDSLFQSLLISILYLLVFPAPALPYFSHPLQNQFIWFIVESQRDSGYTFEVTADCGTLGLHPHHRRKPGQRKKNSLVILLRLRVCAQVFHSFHKRRTWQAGVL